MITTADVKELVAALEGVLFECRKCHKIATWAWQDEDGTEYLCDEHKDENFYAYGPEELQEVRRAIAILDKVKGDLL